MSESDTSQADTESDAAVTENDNVETENSTSNDTVETENSTSNDSDETKDIITIINENLDSELTHKPTYEEVASIEKGMSIDEIRERLGKPHRFGPTSGVPSLEWETSDGYICYIVFRFTGGAPDPKNMNPYVLLFEYSVASSINIYKS